MEAHPFIAFLKRHGSKSFFVVLALICIIFWAVRSLEDKKSQYKDDFLIAAQIFEQFQQGECPDLGTIKTAETILTRHPELHPKCDALIALALFSQSQGAEALPYIQSLLDCKYPQLPSCYREYTHTTLLIASQAYPAAYAAALDLKAKIPPGEGYQNLDALNTLRLFFLAHLLGDGEQQKQLQPLLEHHPAFPQLLTLFHEEGLSLTDYLHSVQ
jgi:hypothetical protein